MHYTGEKKPIMWWSLFERRLTNAFQVFDKKEQREVYSDQMKLRSLLGKINCEVKLCCRIGSNYLNVVAEVIKYKILMSDLLVSSLFLQVRALLQHFINHIFCNILIHSSGPASCGVVASCLQMAVRRCSKCG